MFESMTHDITQYLIQHPTQGGLVAFIFAFLESLAIIGSLIPGSVTMTAIGSMIGLSVLPMGMTFAWTISGALIGDYLSYWVGIRYEDQIKCWKWVQRYDHWFVKAEHFVARYGIASVIIGRFFGPMRSMMPMIAGILKMSPLRFTLAIIPAAILWSIVYLFPGILLGALSLDFSGTTAIKLIVYMLALMALSILIYRMFKQPVASYLRNYHEYLLAFVKRHTLNAHPLFSSDIHHTLFQLKCLIKSLGAFLLFGLIGYGVSHQTWITYANQPIYHLMQNIHIEPINYFMQFFTSFADKKVLFATSLFASTLMLIQRSKRVLAFVWTIYVMASAMIIKCSKVFFHIERPPILSDILGHTSFPSGHMSYLSALLLFISLVITFIIPAQQQRKRLSQLTVVMLILIGLSRMYLGAHWLTDIIGGLSLGFAIAYLGAALLTPYLRQTQLPYQLIKLSGIVWILSTIIYNHLHFTNYYQNAFPNPEQSTLSLQQWHDPDSTQLSYVRNNRFGHPRDIMNIRWARSGQSIMQILKQAHWTCINFPEDFLTRLWMKFTHQNYSGLPLIIPHYKKQSPIIIAIKPETQTKVAVLYLWPSHHFYQHKPVWLGTLYTANKRHHAIPIWGKRSYHLSPIQPILNHEPHTIRMIHPQHQQYTHLSWDGRLLMLPPHSTH
ncbi:MAG: hypothetical protein CMF51_01080 [Legionellales bacterium]|nr:hypothetical protein [Legionellales bacterium]